MRVVMCTEQCGIVGLRAYQLNDHLESQCPMRDLMCPHGCGEIFNAFDINQHAVVCAFAPVPCPLECKAEIPRKLLESHCADDCPMREVSCACGDCMVQHQLSHHKEFSCLLRMVTCPQQCGMSVQASELEDHKQNNCPNRSLQCTECGIKVSGKAFNQHKASCPHRVVPCPLLCATDGIKALDLDRHMSQDCPNQEMPCPLGCDTPGVTTSTLDRHMKEVCPLRSRYVACPLSCPEELIDDYQKIRNHVRNECPNRPAECKNHCGTKGLIFREKAHHETICAAGPAHFAT